MECKRVPKMHSHTRFIPAAYIYNSCSIACRIDEKRVFLVNIYILACLDDSMKVIFIVITNLNLPDSFLL